MWEPYSVLSKGASLPEEEEAEDGGDDRLCQGEDEEGRLHSSDQLLLWGTRNSKLIRNDSMARENLFIDFFESIQSFLSDPTNPFTADVNIKLGLL